MLSLKCMQIKTNTHNIYSSQFEINLFVEKYVCFAVKAMLNYKNILIRFYLYKLMNYWSLCFIYCRDFCCFYYQKFQSEWRPRLRFWIRFRGWCHSSNSDCARKRCSQPIIVRNVLLLCSTLWTPIDGKRTTRLFKICQRRMPSYMWVFDLGFIDPYSHKVGMT